MLHGDYSHISFHEMAKISKHLDTPAFSSFLGVRIEIVLLTSNLFPSISLVVGQSSVNRSLVTGARDVSTSRLTSSQ